MIASIDISLSGLNAANTRVQAAASNIVNARSTGHGTEFDADPQPYQPLRVAQSSLQQGGVRAEIVPDRTVPIAVFDPGNPAADANGTVRFPNVSIEAELVEMKLATQAYTASIAILEAESEMLGELLDAIT